MEQVLLWLATAGAGGALVVAAIRLGLPFVRKLVPTYISARAGLEASQLRLIESLQHEVENMARQLSATREELAHASQDVRDAREDVRDLKRFIEKYLPRAAPALRSEAARTRRSDNPKAP